MELSKSPCHRKAIASRALSRAPCEDRATRQGCVSSRSEAVASVDSPAPGHPYVVSPGQALPAVGWPQAVRLIPTPQGTLGQSRGKRSSDTEAAAPLRTCGGGSHVEGGTARLPKHRARPPLHFLLGRGSHTPHFSQFMSGAFLSLQARDERQPPRPAPKDEGSGGGPKQGSPPAGM